MLTLPIAPGTYLGNPDEPSFVIGVPPVLTGPPVKPYIGTPMVGPLVEFINNFWPLWDTTPGTPTVVDIILGNNGAITGDLTWEAALYGQGVGGHVTIGTDKIAIAPVLLEGSYALERLISLDGVWTHEVTSYDPSVSLITPYRNGVAGATSPYSESPLAVNDLIAWNGEAIENPVILEYARIWNRALTSYEVADLYANPYSLFGISQELLDEITTIINFMKPMNTSWSFITI